MMKRIFKAKSPKKPLLSPAEKKAAGHKKKVEKIKAFLEKYLFPLSVALVFILLSPFIYTMVTRMGIGSRFPEKYFKDMKPIHQASDLDVVAELPMPPGNVAVSSGGRIFFTFHPEYQPSEIKVAEMKSKSKTKYVAYPSAEYQSNFVTCLSLRVDKQDRLWVLDFGNHAMWSRPKLTAFAIKKKNNNVVKEYTFPAAVAGFGSMLNDFQVDPTGKFIYIADTGIVSTDPGLVVYSVEDDTSHRILSSHSSMFGFSSFLNVAGTWLAYGPMGLKINVDSIALDRTGTKLYYGALTGNKLYSIATSHLLHYVRTPEEDTTKRRLLAKAMPDHIAVVLSEKPATDGIAVDGAGNIWMTCLEHAAIGVAMPIKMHADLPAFARQEIFKTKKVVNSTSLLRWPDGLSFGGDGALYISNSALHYKFSGQSYKPYAPFHILKLSKTSV